MNVSLIGFVMLPWSSAALSLHSLGGDTQEQQSRVYGFQEEQTGQLMQAQISLVQDTERGIYVILKIQGGFRKKAWLYFYESVGNQT